MTTTAITEYSPIEAVLADLTARHKGVVFDVAQPSGMKAAKAAAKDIAQYRIALEKKRVELKADVLERGRLIDGEAKRISAQLAAIEDPIVDQIKAEERREEEARQAAIRAEQERIAAEERARKEAEERALAEQRAEIARQRAALEAEQRAAREKAEAEDRERRARIEAEERAARERIEAERRRVMEEENRIAAERRRLEDERLQREREEQAKLLAEQRAKEEAERKEREAREAAEREARRKEAERLDSRRMLETFCERFGHLHPELAKHIREYLAQAGLKVAA